MNFYCSRVDVFVLCILGYGVEEQLLAPTI